jgi:hypothetical protein
MKLYNCNVVGEVVEENDVATMIKLVRAPYFEHAKELVLGLFKEVYPEFEVILILIDKITIDEYNVVEMSVYSESEGVDQYV